MAPPTAGEDTSNPDSDDPSEVAVALDEADDGLADAIESALAGRSAIVAVGVPLALLPRYSPRESAQGEEHGGSPVGRASPTRLAGRSSSAPRSPRRSRRERSSFGRSRTNQTSSEFCSRRRTESTRSSDRRRIEHSLPRRRRNESRPRAERCASGSRRRRPRPSICPREAACSRPPARRSTTGSRTTWRRCSTRSRTARVGRTGEVTDRTLLVALAARHDHLLWDLRRWIGDGADGGSAEGVGIAAGQDLTDDRRALVRRGLIEAIKMPAGDGRPQLRLRAVDDALLRATPEEVLSVLRGRFALPVDEDGRVRQPPGRDERRPVWERTRRDKN